MIRRMSSRSEMATGIFAAGLMAVLVLAPGLVRAQSSANFKITGKVLPAAGRSTSANFAMTGEMDYGLGRTSSNLNDEVPGFIGQVFSSQATSTITTTAGTFASVGFPLNTSSNLVSSMLGALGGVDHTEWRLGHFSPVDSAYMEVGGSLPFTTISRGLGYWLITRADASITTTGLPARTDQLVQVALQSGPAGRPAWNQVANPFTYPMSTSSMIVDNGGGTAFILSNPANTLTLSTVKVRSGSSFADATVINGRQAFWVRKLTNGTVTLSMAPVPSATGSPAPALQKPEGASWGIAIRTSQGDRSAETVWLGAAPVSGPEWNALSSPRGPNLPAGEDLALYVPKRDWGLMSADYVHLFQPPADHMGWDLVLSGTDGPGEVTLVTDAVDLPAGTRMWLTDPMAGWTRELHSGGVTTVAVGTGPRALRVETTSGGSSLESAPVADAFRNAYPNPFRAGTGLGFSLARAGDVSVDVFDVQGRLVRSLERRGLSPGEHVLVWDGRDALGHAAPSGVYLTRWRAGSIHGGTRLVKLD